MLELLLPLMAFAFVTSITPGPNNLMLLASGTNFGIRRSLPHLMGIWMGVAAMTGVLGLGLGQVFQAYPVIQTVLKVCSAVFLAYLAWKIATAAPLHADSGQGGEGKPLTFLQAALFQWLNPKAWYMVLTVVSVYTVPEYPRLSLLFVIATFSSVNLPCIMSWLALGTQLRRFLSSPLKLRVFNVAAALALLATLYPILKGV